MSTRRIESFLLRLVVDEQHGADDQVWCGRIQHVASGYERHFGCLQEVLAFIGEQSAAVGLSWPIADSPSIDDDIQPYD